MQYRLPHLGRLRNLTGKVVLVRVDYNAEVAEDALRLPRSLQTIERILDRGGSVVLASHRARPKAGVTKDGKPKHVTKETTMRFALPFLKKHFKKTPIHFVNHFDFPKIAEKIIKTDGQSIFVLENLRFHPGEKARDEAFARGLASLADIYVNDAFAVSHRSDASVTMIPELLSAYAGYVVLSEVKHLSHVMDTPKKPLVVILGGGKAHNKFSVIRFLHKKANAFLIGGILGNTFLKSLGMEVKDSVIDESILGDVKEYMHDKKIEVSSDWNYDDERRIMDIGILTVNRFESIIKDAKTVIWNGPMGKFEDPLYRSGSVAIAHAVAKSKAFSVVGGGETTQLILQLGLSKQYNFLSTGGGAMLSFLAGKEMPGLSALMK